MKRTLLIFMAVLTVGILPVFAQGKEKLMVYTSMKEVLIGELRDAFVKKHPNVQFDYYSAGAGKIMAKIAAERQSGKLVVDVLWTSEVPDFYALKKEGVLQKYKVAGKPQYVVSPLNDPDYEFHPPPAWAPWELPYNTNKIKTPAHPMV
jgi:ABC-type Fe3+ transport system, periplasmic component